MTVPKRSLRLVAEDFSDISSLTGENGELVYDATNMTIRISDGSTQGGVPLATQNWVIAHVATGGITVIDGGSATG